MKVRSARATRSRGYGSIPGGTIPRLCGACLAALLALVLGACDVTTAPEADGERALDWVHRLASDDLQGRRSGTPEGAAAAALIADAFREAGLEPAGDDGSYQHRFRFPFYRFVQPAEIDIESTAGGLRLVWGRDFYFLNGSSGGSGAAGVTFVGYGVRAGEYDDYAGVDVRGKIVLAIEGLPDGLGLERSLASSLGKARIARSLGAAGLLVFGDPAAASPLTKSRIWVFRPDRYLEDFVFAQISVPVADEILGGEAVELAQRIVSTGRPTSRDLDTRARWTATVEYRPQAEATNVLGMLRGADPDLSGELVLIGAHYDGGGPDPDGTIYNGAEDNASGTAALLEIARVLAARGDPIRRSVMFAAWGAEEQGAWGSIRFVEEEVWPLDRLAATFTLDNVGMGEGTFRLFGAHNFPREWRAIAAGIDPAILARLTPRGAGGSDGWTFQQRGIPAIFAHADAPQPFVHTPEDDASTISADMLEAVARFGHQGLVAAANAPPGTFDSEDRLARYLSRYTFAAGWLDLEGEGGVDWDVIAASQVDMLIIVVDSPESASRVAADLPDDVTLVARAADLSSTEAGAPVRVLLAVRGEPGAEVTVALADSRARAFVVQADGEPTAARIMPLPAAAAAAMGELRPVEATHVRLVGGFDDLPIESLSELSLIIDIGAGVELESLVTALLERGLGTDAIQASLGETVRRRMQAALAGGR